MKKVLLVCLVMSAFIFTGCEYFTGPQGEQGPAGPGTIITEFTYPITATDEAISTSFVEINDPFFEVGVRIEVWIRSPAGVGGWRTDTWQPARDVLFADEYAMVTAESLFLEGCIVTFYKFEPTS